MPPLSSSVHQGSELICASVLPKLDLVFDRSIIALLLGLFSTDLLAREMSAVTLVIDILRGRTRGRPNHSSQVFSALCRIYSYIPFQSAQPRKHHSDVFYSELCHWRRTTGEKCCVTAESSVLCRGLSRILSAVLLNTLVNFLLPSSSLT